MPGYGWIYFLLRMVLPVKPAYEVILILQLVLSAVSVYFLALTARMIFKSDRLFYFVFFCYLFSTYVSIFDIYLLTESFATSSSIFGLYFLLLALHRDKKSLLIPSGLFFSWVIFLRPVYAPYLAICGFCILFYKSGFFKSYLTRIKWLFIFLLPFLLFDSIWIFRNYQTHNRFIPLTKVFYGYQLEEIPYHEFLLFLQSWGGNYIYWDPDAEVRWFGIKGERFNVNWINDKPISLPTYIYTSAFNEDSLLIVKNMLEELFSDTIARDNFQDISQKLKLKLVTYTESIRKEKPYLFYVKSRLINMQRYVMHNGTYNLMKVSWSNLSLLKKGIKLIYAGLYVLTLCFGAIGIVLLVSIRRTVPGLILVMITLFGLVVFPFFLRLIEMRYFVPTYPYMLVCAMFALNYGLEKFSNKGRNGYSSSIP